MFRRILVPLDGSRTSEAVLPLARRFLQEAGAEVHLLRVLPPATADASFAFAPGLAMPPSYPLLSPEARAEAIADVRRYLEEQAARALAGGTVHPMVREGDPAREIVAGAREAGAEAIVMSTHGRSGLGRLVLGSVAEAVVREAGLPVVLVRPGAEAARGG